MKNLVHIEVLSCFIYKVDFKTRTEREYYSNGTSSVVEAQYILKRGASHLLEN